MHYFYIKRIINEFYWQFATEQPRAGVGVGKAVQQATPCAWICRNNEPYSHHLNSAPWTSCFPLMQIRSVLMSLVLPRLDCDDGCCELAMAIFLLNWLSRLTLVWGGGKLLPCRESPVSLCMSALSLSLTLVPYIYSHLPCDRCSKRALLP